MFEKRSGAGYTPEPVCVKFHFCSHRIECLRKGLVPGIRRRAGYNYIIAFARYGKCYKMTMMMMMMIANHFHITLFYALEQTHCTHMLLVHTGLFLVFP